ncbi:substrate-binding domain-containing protein [Kineococcus sp. R8]|uniref:LacI family DNA-binding transcriptional regulator n=1 Tax=Kineococcus siccus TaxID=2696567 RepID=UPI0014122AA4|nr:LacI family DNA-binding transcriptional regulator [Kineococcus siccus]NAZ81600.1 substrate-binding domain-containing protein [Kineococcus siccus]
MSQLSPDTARGRHPSRSAATIHDVAAAAGVSRQTVTRAMNDLPDISAATKARVLAAAGALHYRPSRFGRGLAVKGSHRTVGLVVNDLTNPYYPEFAAAVLGAAAQRDWNVLLVDSVHATDRRRQLMDLAQQVDAMIGYFDIAPGEEREVLGGMPSVEIDPTVERRSGGVVELDVAPAVEDAVAHLLAHGVRHPWMVEVSDEGLTSGRGRLVSEAFARAGVPLRLVWTSATSVDAGRTAVEPLLRADVPCDAVVAWNDVIALGVLEACRRHGVDVPGDVRVLGIDGLPLGTWVTPQLSSLALDMAAVAGAAIDLAVGLHDGELSSTTSTVVRRVAHRFVRRASA